MRHQPGNISRRAFSLIEVLIVVVILGILAAMVVPQFSDATSLTQNNSVLRQLQVIRHQIDYFRAQQLADPELVIAQWDDLVMNDYLHWTPINPMNQSSTVAASAGTGVGWVWRDNGWGVNQLYATNSTWDEFSE